MIGNVQNIKLIMILIQVEVSFQPYFLSGENRKIEPYLQVKKSDEKDKLIE